MDQSPQVPIIVKPVVNQTRRRVTPIVTTQYNLNSPILPTKQQVAPSAALDDEEAHGYANMLYDSAGADEYGFFAAAANTKHELSRYLSLDEKALNRMGEQADGQLFTLITNPSLLSSNITVRAKSDHTPATLSVASSSSSTSLSAVNTSASSNTSSSAHLVVHNGIERKKNASDSNMKTADHNFYHISQQFASKPKPRPEDHLIKNFNNSLLMLSTHADVYDSLATTTNSPKFYAPDTTSNTSSNNFSLNLSIHTAEEFSKEMFAWLQNEHKRTVPVTKPPPPPAGESQSSTTVTTTAATLV
jgi:hypothetical protein